jgi:hypothetical protein
MYVFHHRIQKWKFGDDTIYLRILVIKVIGIATIPKCVAGTDIKDPSGEEACCCRIHSHLGLQHLVREPCMFHSSTGDISNEVVDCVDLCGWNVSMMILQVMAHVEAQKESGIGNSVFQNGSARSLAVLSRTWTSLALVWGFGYAGAAVTGTFQIEVREFVCELRIVKVVDEGGVATCAGAALLIGMMCVLVSIGKGVMLGRGPWENVGWVGRQDLAGDRRNAWNDMIFDWKSVFLSPKLSHRFPDTGKLNGLRE